MPTYSCPKCFGNMVVRASKKTGWNFYGCANFPNCNGMRNMEGQNYIPRTGKRYKTPYYGRNTAYNAPVTFSQAQLAAKGMAALAQALTCFNHGFTYTDLTTGKGTEDYRASGASYAYNPYNPYPGYSIFRAFRNAFEGLANILAFAATPEYKAQVVVPYKVQRFGMAIAKLAFAANRHFFFKLQPARDITRGIYLTSPLSGRTIHVHGDKLGIGFSWLRQRAMAKPGTEVMLAKDEIAQLARAKTF